MDRELEILLLEDNAADAELAQRELRKAGFRFKARVVANRDLFLQALDSLTPDIILVDFSLPGFDGLTALRLTRDRFAHLPVIVVSGAVGEETAIDALKAGATDYVLKQRLYRLGSVVGRAVREWERLEEKERAEAQLASEREALRQSEQTLRLLIDAITDCAIYLISTDGRVETWNAGAQRILQWSASEIIGQPISTFFSLVDVVRGAPQRQVAIATRDGMFDEEAFRVRKDGTIFWARVTLTPIRGEDGSLRGFATVLRDITHSVRSGVDLSAARLIAERARVDAEAANDAKDHFLAVLSHELRTPLTPALAVVGMLQQDPRFDAETRESLDVIRRNVDLEARLIDDLLDVTRIVHGKVELNREVVDVSMVVRRAIEVCLPDIEARLLEFGVSVNSGGCMVEGDPARLQQVVWNLLKNAIKFTPKGGCVGVTVRREQAGERGGTPGSSFVEVEVADSGEGIDPDVLPRIFKPFEQGGKHITRQFGGLGLGLGISKAIVELHGGSITALSEGRGRGARFIFRLPVIEHAAVRCTADDRPLIGPQSVRRSLRILLVEDHGDTARAMKRILAAQGHEVSTAGDVATALERARISGFDLLISDLGLPDGTGVDLLRELRAAGNTAPAIALSGFGQEQDLARTKEAGYCLHLIKPTTQQRLMEAIATAVHGDL